VDKVHVERNFTVYIDVCEVQCEGIIIVYIDVFLRYRVREILLCKAMSV